MKLSVVIPTLGDKLDQLRLVLTSLRLQNWNWPGFEVLVCEDSFVPVHGHDRVAELVAEASHLGLHVRHLRHPRTGYKGHHLCMQGAAASRNLGIKNANGERILFLDDDCLAEEGLLSQHTVKKDALIGLRNRVQERDWRPLRPEKLKVGSIPFHPEVRDRTRTLERIDSLCRADSVHIQNYVFSCHVSYPTKVLKQVGGFWEDMKGSGHEDRELALRCHRAGVRFSFLHSPRVWHLDHPQCSSQGINAPDNLRLFHRTLRDPAVVVRNGGPIP